MASPPLPLERIRHDFVLADPFLLDRTVLTQWCSGASVETAAQACAQHMTLRVRDPSLLTCYIQDAYRAFALMEPLLRNPQQFRAQGAVQLRPADKNFLLESYYGFDEVFAREIAGRKLGNTVRKELDSIAERTRVPLVSVRRQFENMRRVYRSIIDMPQRPLQEAISSLFFLSKELAQKYANVCFLAHHRFDLSRRYLPLLLPRDVDILATIARDAWTRSSPADPLGIGLSHVLTKHGRDLRAFVLGDRALCEELRRTAHETLRSAMSASLSEGQFESRFTALLKSVLSVLSSFSSVDALRDVFVDVFEKVFPRLRDMGLDSAATGLLCQDLLGKFASSASLPAERRLVLCETWKMYLDGLKDCLLLYFACAAPSQ